MKLQVYQTLNDDETLDEIVTIIQVIDCQDFPTSYIFNDQEICLNGMMCGSKQYYIYTNTPNQGIKEAEKIIKKIKKKLDLYRVQRTLVLNQIKLNGRKVYKL